MQKAVQRQRMGILLCEKNFREVWSRNESVRAEIGQILRTHTHGSISSKVSQVLRHIQPFSRAAIAVSTHNNNFYSPQKTCHLTY